MVAVQMGERSELAGGVLLFCHPASVAAVRTRLRCCRSSPSALRSDASASELSPRGGAAWKQAPRVVEEGGAGEMGRAA